MAKLPVLSGKELIKVLQREGFVIVRQKGSHIVYTKTNSERLIHLHMISEAKNMLVAGDKSISEIAYQLGFSRLFKKEVGISPKEFQNRLLN